jgi:hypothetical protein
VPGKEALVRANMAKTDEFYTQLADVEQSLRHYRDQFRGKVVFCNCDDPFESSFFPNDQKRRACVPLRAAEAVIALSHGA